VVEPGTGYIPNMGYKEEEEGKGLARGVASFIIIIICLVLA